MSVSPNRVSFKCYFIKTPRGLEQGPSAHYLSDTVDRADPENVVITGAHSRSKLQQHAPERTSAVRSKVSSCLPKVLLMFPNW